MNSPGNGAATPASGWRTGDLEVNLLLRHVRRGGERVAMQDIPFGILTQLLERNGLPVARQELHATFWRRYDQESFERSVNTAMRKLRQAIGDNARAPRLIETMRGSGYRWIGPPPEPLHSMADEARALPSKPRRLPGWSAISLAFTAAVLLSGVAIWLGRPPNDVVIELPADNAARDDMAGALARIASLTNVHIETVGDNKASGAVAALRQGRQRHIVPLRNNPEVVQELLVRAAIATPPARDTYAPILPAPLQRELMDATSALSTPDPEIATALRASEQLGDVTTKAPDDSGAWLALARAHVMLAGLGDRTVNHRQSARAALRKAVDANPRSLPAIVALATHLYWQAWSRTAASRWFQLAKTIAPHDPHVLHALAWFELAESRDLDALAHMSAAAATDPLDATLQSDWGWFYYRTGDFAAAALQCHHAAALKNPNPSASECEYHALALEHRFGDAVAVLRASAPPWLNVEASVQLSALPPQCAYSEAMLLAAAWWRTQPYGRFVAATDAAAAGDLVAARADLLAAIRNHEPAAHLFNATPELAMLRHDADVVRELARATGDTEAPKG